MKWFLRIGNRNQLPDLLKDYPAYQAPHPQRAATLSADQANENLQYLLDRKEFRLQVFDQFLNYWDINVLHGLRHDKPESLVSDLHRWSGNVWPQAYDKKIAAKARWQETSRQGSDIIYSLIMDTAILLGELIVAQRPSYRWTADLNEDNIKDGMLSVKRCVLEARFAPDPSVPIIVDVEATAVDRFLYPTDFSQRHENLWWRTVENALTGAYEAEHLVNRP